MAGEHLGRTFLAAALCAFSAGCQPDSGDADRIAELEDQNSFLSWELSECQRTKTAAFRALAILDGVSVEDEVAQKIVDDMIAVLRDDSAYPEHWMAVQEKLAANPVTKEIAEEVRKAIAGNL